MDFSNFKTPDWLMIGGGVGIFVFGFFNWVTVEVGGFDVGSTGNVFDFFWTGTIPWILVIASGVVAFLLAQGSLKEDQLPWPLLLLAATGLASLLLLIRLIFNPVEGSGISGVDVGRGIGMILSVLSGLVAAAGAYLNFQASGGNLKDLTDIDKLKSSFSNSDGDDAPPPPPSPPADPTPPPPPPAPPAPPAPPTPPAPPAPPAPPTPPAS